MPAPNEQIKVREITPEEIKLDDRNLNRHTDKGKELVNKSFSELGAGRSGVSDRNGKMIAGNLSVETAIEKGLKIVEVETEGDTYIVVKRKDLDLDSTTDNRARKLALTDNATSAVSLDWDFEEMASVSEDFGFEVEEWGVEMPGEWWSSEGQELPDYSSKNKEIDTDGFEDKMKICLEYTMEEFHQVKAELSKIAATPEQAVWKLLNLPE